MKLEQYNKEEEIQILMTLTVKEASELYGFLQGNMLLEHSRGVAAKFRDELMEIGLERLGWSKRGPL